MIKLKKIFILYALFLFFLGCGYTPIFSKKEVNFSIENIKFLGDEDVKRNINNALSSYKNKPDKEKKIKLLITNLKNITIASKNAKGEAQTKRISVDANVKIILAENNFIEKSFHKSTIYTVLDRKSKQKSNENKLIENLSNEIALEIIFEILKNIKYKN